MPLRLKCWQKVLLIYSSKWVVKNQQYFVYLVLTNVLIYLKTTWVMGSRKKLSFLTHATSVTLCQYFLLYSWDCFQWSLKMIWEQLLSILFLIWWMKKVLEFSVYFTVFYFQEELKSELFRLETLYKKVHILSNFSALRKTCKIKLTNLSLI